MRIAGCKRIVGFLATGGMLFALAGCGTSHARYTPSADEARTALETALNAWVDGKRVGPIESTPPVRVVDSTWLAGKKLASFRVVDEKPGDDGTKRFTVLLNLKSASPKTDKAQEVAYVVHGRDPVWVFNGEDYQRVLNMDNNKPIPRTSPRGRGM